MSRHTHTFINTAWRHAWTLLVASTPLMIPPAWAGAGDKDKARGRDPSARRSESRAAHGSHEVARSAADTDVRSAPTRGNAIDGSKPGKTREAVRGSKHANGPVVQDRVLTKGSAAQRLELGRQLELRSKGDLARQLDLPKRLKSRGGWGAHHWSGWIGASFGTRCSPITYCGPSYFPSHCLYPNWSDWVSFCWWYEVDPQSDPRPWFCRPAVYEPCGTWVWWSYPAWDALPAAACGTWVDVAPVVIGSGTDLQLLAVRFVDPGHAAKQLGARYRVWIRNNSRHAIADGFNVVLLAANSREPAAEWPQSGVRVTAIEPGQIQAVDVRLPWGANVFGRAAAGDPTPFSQLHVLLDSDREIPEVFEENNGAVIARGDVLPVDPAIFGCDQAAPASGAEIRIAGEGFGPGPGQVLVHVGGVELQAEILGWYDLGVHVRLPALALASPADAKLIIVRGDTAASNPLDLRLAAAK